MIETLMREYDKAHETPKQSFAKVDADGTKDLWRTLPAPPREERILVIDDIREYEGCVHAKTAQQGIALLQEGPWDEVWLDHDLGVGTIRPVIDYMVANKVEVDYVWIITANPAGQKYMVDALREKYRVRKEFGGFNMSRKILVYP